MGPVIDGINDTLDELEDRVVDPHCTINQIELVTLRQQAIKLHRYVKPQVQALTSLHATKTDMLGTNHRRDIKDTINRVTRFLEDLDAAKSRSSVIQDELANQVAQRINQRMYVVTIIAAIFLPLTFIAGLLGANVGGIPGATNEHGFIFTTVVLAVMGVVGFLLARWSKWL
jgi:zinc transporter